MKSGADSNVMDLESVRLSEVRQKVGNNLRCPLQVESKKKKEEMTQISLQHRKRLMDREKELTVARIWLGLSGQFHPISGLSVL